MFSLLAEKLFTPGARQAIIFEAIPHFKGLKMMNVDYIFVDHLAKAMPEDDGNPVTFFLNPSLKIKAGTKNRSSVNIHVSHGERD